MNLPTQYLHDPELGLAVEEVLTNAERLYLGGYFQAAFNLTYTLLSPGAWQVPPTTMHYHRLAHLHPIFCWATKQPCPALADEPARNHRQLSRWAQQQHQQILEMLAISDRLQLETAGQAWSEAYFAEVATMRTENGKYIQFGQFINDLDWVLKKRFQRSLKIQANDLLPDFVKEYSHFRTDAEINCATVTKQYSTAWLTAFLDQCTTAQPELGGYLEHKCYQYALLMSLAAKETAQAVQQLHYLLAKQGQSEILHLAYEDELRKLLQQGVLAQALDLDDAQVAAYQDAFSHRKPALTVPIPPSATAEAHPPATKTQIIKALAATSLKQFTVNEVAIPESEHSAMVLHDIPVEQTFFAWQTAHAVQADTQRWPVLVVLDFENLEFDPDYYSTENFSGIRTGLTPKDLIRGVDTVNVGQKLIQQAAEATDPEITQNFLKESLADLSKNHGLTVKPEQLLAKLDLSAPTAERDIAWRLHQLHTEHGIRVIPDRRHLDWFELANVDYGLVLFPIQQSWQTLAFLHWYGADYIGSEVVMALLRQWQQQYEADLVAHYGTMLQFVVKKPPTTFTDALQLAWEQTIIAPCTTALPGVNLDEHAYSLINAERWFLHERP